jgi:hypothetical protein
MEDEGNVSQLPGLIKEWMTTEDELRSLSAAIREKRKRAKAVRATIVKIMKGGKIGRLNISAGAVTATSKATKAPLTKKYIKEKLTEFFNGDAVKAEACAKFLDEHRPLKSTDNLALDPL